MNIESSHVDSGNLVTWQQWCSSNSCRLLSCTEQLHAMIEHKKRHVGCCYQRSLSRQVQHYTHSFDYHIRKYTLKRRAITKHNTKNRLAIWIYSGGGIGYEYLLL